MRRCSESERDTERERDRERDRERALVLVLVPGGAMDVRDVKLRIENFMD